MEFYMKLYNNTYHLYILLLIVPIKGVFETRRYLDQLCKKNRGHKLVEKTETHVDERSKEIRERLRR